MHNLIETLRGKPKQVRNLYAFLTAFVVTGIIAGVWATSIPARFSSQTNDQGQEDTHASSWSQSLQFMQQDIAQFSSTVRSLGSKLEYSKDDQTTLDNSQDDAPSMIDLNTLVASSTDTSTSTTKAAVAATTSEDGSVH